MVIQEIRVFVEEAMSGAKEGDSGLNSRSVTIVIKKRVIVKLHLISKTGKSERVLKDGTVLPEPEPVSIFTHSSSTLLFQWLVLLIVQPGFKLVSSLPWDYDQWVKKKRKRLFGEEMGKLEKE